MAYIGNIARGAASTVIPSDTKQAMKFTASSTFSAGYMAVCIVNAYYDPFRLAIYSDSGGSPSALLGYTEEYPSNDKNTSGWVYLKLTSPVSITNGNDYWLAYLGDGSLGVYKNTAANASRFVTDDYTDGFSDPFGSPTTGSDSWSIHASDEVLFVAQGTLAAGGSVVTDSSGNTTVMTPAFGITPVRMGDPPTLLTDQSAVSIHGSGVVAYIDAAIDSNDIIHVVSACSSEQTRDVAYNKFGGSGPYYFNDATPGDPNSVWTDDTYAFDSSDATGAYSSAYGSTNYLEGGGTTAPSTGSATISDVRVRFKIDNMDSVPINIRVAYSAEVLLNQNAVVSGASYTGWYSLSTPSGGWDWAKVNALQALFYSTASGSGYASIYKGEIVVLHENDWSEEDWIQIGNYTETAPTNQGVAISIDSNNYPGVLYVDAVKSGGSTQDNVYYTKFNGVSWGTAEQVGVRVVKTDYYYRPDITFKGSDYVEAFYVGYTGSGNGWSYRTRTTSWGSESQYTVSSGMPGSSYIRSSVTATSGGTVYRYMWYGTVLYIYENAASTGYTPHTTNGAPLGVLSPSDGTTRYVFYIDSASDIHLISNSGSGWTNEGTIQTGTFYRVIPEWAYNHENQSGGINYIYDDGTYIYYDFLSFVTQESGSITADAYIATSGVTDSIDADAIIKKSQSGSISAKSIIEKAQNDSVSADALIVQTTSDSVDADAIIFKSVESSIASKSIIKKSTDDSINASATIVRTISGSVDANAIITSIAEDSISANATILSSVSGSIDAKAIIISSVEDSITTDAIVSKAREFSITSYALIQSTAEDSILALAAIKSSAEYSITANAYIAGAIVQDITADAIILRSASGDISARAIVSKSLESSISARAIVEKEVQNYIGADAAIFKSTESGIFADATIAKEISGGIFADAIISYVVEDEVSADAVIEKPSESSIYASAIIVDVGTPIWVSPADTSPIGSTPVLVFTMPSSVGNMHFHMQLDTADTFDTGDLREYKTNMSQVGWEYWDGDSWEPFPAGGVANTYSGNDCRYTVQVPLSGTTWYRRVRGGLA